MFELRQSGPVGGDETSTYSVSFDSQGPRTIGQFIDDLISGHSSDWGFIEIRDSMRPAVRCGGASYSRGKFERPVAPEFLNKQIRSISAAGGWSRMDYMIFV